MIGIAVQLLWLTLVVAFGAYRIINLLVEIRDLLEDASTERAAERGVAAMREARLTPDTTPRVEETRG